jgi:hypothetical protein
MISTGQGKVFRERGWWRSGQDKLASYATPLEGWVAKGQILDVGLISALTGALQNTALNEKPFLDDSILAHYYRQGTEMGLLGGRPCAQIEFPPQPFKQTVFKVPCAQIERPP